MFNGRQLHIHCSDSDLVFVSKANIGHSNRYGPNGPNRMAIMALKLADRGEKLQSETLSLYFCRAFSLYNKKSMLTPTALH